MSRWRQLQRNLGRWGSYQLLFVAVAMLAATGLMAAGGAALPLLALLSTALLVTALRETLVEHLQRTVSAMRWGWGCLIALALGGGFLLEQGLLTPVQSLLGVVALAVCSGAYLSAAFWVWSDPTVYRTE